MTRRAEHMRADMWKSITQSVEAIEKTVAQVIAVSQVYSSPTKMPTQAALQHLRGMNSRAALGLPAIGLQDLLRQFGICAETDQEKQLNQMQTTLETCIKLLTEQARLLGEALGGGPRSTPLQ